MSIEVYFFTSSVLGLPRTCVLKTRTPLRRARTVFIYKRLNVQFRVIKSLNDLKDVKSVLTKN